MTHIPVAPYLTSSHLQPQYVDAVPPRGVLLGCVQGGGGGKREGDERGG